MGTMRTEHCILCSTFLNELLGYRHFLLLWNTIIIFNTQKATENIQKYLLSIYNRSFLNSKYSVRRPCIMTSLRHKEQKHTTDSSFWLPATQKLVTSLLSGQRVILFYLYTTCPAQRSRIRTNVMVTWIRSDPEADSSTSKIIQALKTC